MAPVATWAMVSRGGGLRGDHRLGLVVGAGGGGEQQRAVGDRRLDGVEQFDLVEDVVGAGGGAAGMDVRPAVARLDEAQPGQAEIAHGAGAHADVLAELRLDQHDDGAVDGRHAALVLSVPEPDIALHFLIQRLSILNHPVKVLTQGRDRFCLFLHIGRFIKQNDGLAWDLRRFSRGTEMRPPRIRRRRKIGLQLHNASAFAGCSAVL